MSTTISTNWYLYWQQRLARDLMEMRDEHALSLCSSLLSPNIEQNTSEISPHGQSKEERKFQYLLLGLFLSGGLMEAFNL